MFSHADSAAGALHTTQHAHTHTKSSGRPLISVAYCHGSAISHMLPANLPPQRPALQNWLERWHEYVSDFTLKLDNRCFNERA